MEFSSPIPGESHPIVSPARDTGVNISRFNRVFVLVSDFAAAKQAWEANLGLTMPHSTDAPLVGVHAGLMAVGSAHVELMTPLSDEGPVADYLKERGECIYMLSLETPDLEGAIAALRAKDVRVTDIMEAPGNARVALVSPRSTFGMLIQLRLAPPGAA
ncbi:MAG: VOC family protein [Dehalococcoidia bacterium]